MVGKCRGISQNLLARERLCKSHFRIWFARRGYLSTPLWSLRLFFSKERSSVGRNRSTVFFSPKILQTSYEDKSYPLTTFPPFEKRVDTPSQEDWEKGVLDVLEKIKKKQLQKVVLARRTTLIFRKEINPFDILKHLKRKNLHATLFFIQFSKEVTFLGVTPEKLYSRHQNLLWIDALAGTSPRGKTAALLHSMKQRKEFSLVKEFIQEKLATLCEEMHWQQEDTIVKTAHIQHLYNQLEARLKKNLSDQELIALLHPTPAIGGFPQHEALSYLRKKEPFERGHYAAPIGWLSSEETHLSIAIRSALIRGNEMHLFAGAGIVKNSHPQKEWNELDSKLSNFLNKGGLHERALE